MIDTVALRDPETGRWLIYSRPVEVVITMHLEEVVEALEKTEELVALYGLHAAGFVAYEAAPAFDAAHKVVPPDNGFPLVCFGLFEPPAESSGCPFHGLEEYSVGSWAASEDEHGYHESVARIRSHIAGGDTYQVNHTFRLCAAFQGDPRAFFLDLIRAQPSSYAAYFDLGDWFVCSASPELFFRLDGRRIMSRPMKGTANRGHDLISDCRNICWLRNSEKNRAENAMIVDMVRNDLGRVARVGTVEVTSSFDVERHPTVFQMTSTVTAESDASVTEVFGALFPFASVTGAPKVRTMELISNLESAPRGVYTGAIGIIQPGRKARFSVGIRTALVDRAAETIEYGVGSGVVWDSVAEDEYRECITKAKILSEPIPDFDLLETILWEPNGGFSLLDRHLDRLAGAAEYFCRPFDRERVLERLGRVPGEFRSCRERDEEPVSVGRDNCGTPDLAPPLSLRVRLLLAGDGSVRIESTRVEVDADPLPVRLGLAGSPVAPENPFLHFKTTHREVYETARRSRPDCDDVLLWNERGEVTESTIANLVAKIDGKMVTPPVECGLLAGTFRAELVERGEIRERVIRVDELADIEALFLINSVQGWREVEWEGKYS